MTDFAGILPQNPNTKQNSRYRVLSKTNPGAPRVTTPHQSLWTNHPYLIGAISAVSLAALGFAAFAGYKHLNPSIPNNTWSDKTVAAYDYFPKLAHGWNDSVCNLALAVPRWLKILNMLAIPGLSVESLIIAKKRFHR